MYGACMVLVSIGLTANGGRGTVIQPTLLREAPGSGTAPTKHSRHEQRQSQPPRAKTGQAASIPVTGEERRASSGILWDAAEDERLRALVAAEDCSRA